MITYQVESVKNILTEGLSLFIEHYLLVERLTKLKPNPDVHSLFALEESGNLKTFSIRDGNKLIGYSTVLIQCSLHYKDTFYGIIDTIFLTQKRRKGSIGIKFIKFIEDELIKNNVSVITFNSTMMYPLDSLLKRLGYTPTETQHSKYIGN